LVLTGIRVPIIALLTATVTSVAHAQLPADSGAYVVRLGRDTLKIERFVKRDNVIRSESVRRGEGVEQQNVDMIFDSQGYLASAQVRTYKWPVEPGAKPIAGSNVYVKGDSTVLELGLAPNARRVVYAGRGNIFNIGANPFIFTQYTAIAAHAPRTTGDSSVSQHMASILGVRPLVIKRVSPDLVTAQSTIMGLMRMRLDSEGRVRELDGIGSSVNYQAERVGWINLDSAARALEAMNRSTGTIGALSPLDSITVAAGGANVKVNYSRPSKRGRVVFGGIVPWDRIWRTGANVATHFSTDRTLAFGTTVVPPGRYTLFTLPTQSGWTLIISRQTEQWGTEYDPAQDLVRIPMRTRTLTSPVEQLTIGIEPRSRGGVLRVQWDTTEAYADFAVR
jgi:hypothetical protein